MTEGNNTPIVAQAESLKLVRNAKGKYQWEIKLLDMNLERLKDIDKELRRRYVEDGDY